MFNALPSSPLTASTTAVMTGKDPVLSRLYSTLQASAVGSLRDDDDDDFRVYVQRASELNISHSCITFRDCVVVLVATRGQAMHACRSSWCRHDELCQKLVVVAPDKQTDR